MFSTVSHFQEKNKTFPLKQNLICANYGIYVAACVVWNQRYVGRTVNNFVKRWTAHRWLRYFGKDQMRVMISTNWLYRGINATAYCFIWPSQHPEALQKTIAR